jgi:hypothetical protein
MGRARFDATLEDVYRGIQSVSITEDEVIRAHPLPARRHGGTDHGRGMQLSVHSDAYILGLIDVLLKHHRVLVALADDPNLTRYARAPRGAALLDADKGTDRAAEDTLRANLSAIMHVVDAYQLHLGQRTAAALPGATAGAATDGLA